MKGLRYQAGLASTGWLLIIIVASFFLLCAFKMIPAYMENRYIKEALKSLPAHKLMEMEKSEIKKNLIKFYMINNVRSPGSKNINIKRTNKKTLVNINYEVREPLFHNIEVVMTFNNQLDSSKPDFCCRPSSFE